MYLFVYGTLKNGQFNHYLMVNGTYVESDRTSDRYCMFDLGHFPAVAELPGKTLIEGETYDVNEQILKIVDNFEGKWFCRKEILLEGGKAAHMYFLSPDVRNRDFPVIEEGIWKGKRNERE